MTQNIDQTDPLLAYCVALDANDADRTAAILLRAETDAGLESAIVGIHHRFDSTESFTAQLQRERESYQQEAK